MIGSLVETPGKRAATTPPLIKQLHPRRALQPGQRADELGQPGEQAPGVALRTTKCSLRSTVATPFATVTLRTRVPAGTYVRKPLPRSARVGPAEQKPHRSQRSRPGPIDTSELLTLQEVHGNACRLSLRVSLPPRRT